MGQMKMKPEVYAYLEACINKALNEFSEVVLDVARSFKERGYSERRWRWMWFKMAKVTEDKRTGANEDRTGTIIRFNDFFADLTADHIDTALRKLVPSYESILTGEIANAK
jgi:hypothetical protein